MPRIVLFPLLMLLLVGSTALGQSKGDAPKPKLTRILFIFDASNSMNGVWENQPKINVATRLLSEVLDSLQGIENLELALRFFGHQKNYLQGQDCDDTKLEVPFAPSLSDNIKKIKSELRTLRPKGTTPIARTLEKAGKDFPDAKNVKNIIILITDGVEECNGDPCAVSIALQEKGITLKPFVIGIGLDVEFRDYYECVGNYYDASDEQTFKNVLEIVISQAMNTTTAQANLLDIEGNPTETDVNMTFYDQFTGSIRYNYVHTLNHKGHPDTIPLNPAHTYRMVVHTIPPQTLDSIRLTPGKHNIFGLDAPQGDLQLKMVGLSGSKDLHTIVRQVGQLNTLYVQKFSEKTRYIVGKYDLEILTIPRTYVYDVDISQSKTTTVEIKRPGILNLQMLSSGYGSIYLDKKEGLEWVINLTEDGTRESLSLQPGDYRVVFRPKGSKASIFTIEKTFTINSGSSTTIKLY